LKHDDMIVVVGQVGTGKTTFLHSIMQETSKCAGTAEIKGTIAYVEQEPFIFGATVKQNILFGKKYDEE
jgi:ABC-type transport system involved in cytochrome bd biosynthesis fused ATPase/permease subunit